MTQNHASLEKERNCLTLAKLVSIFTYTLYFLVFQIVIFQNIPYIVMYEYLFPPVRYTYQVHICLSIQNYQESSKGCNTFSVVSVSLSCHPSDQNISLAACAYTGLLWLYFELERNGQGQEGENQIDCVGFPRIVLHFIRLLAYQCRQDSPWRLFLLFSGSHCKYL